LEYKASMKKERSDVETFAQKIAQEEDSGMYEAMANTVADKEDNPSIHELAKEFPEKTYKELEQYRNADRHEEANQIPLTQTQKNLVDHIESAVKKSKARLGTCITAEMRKDRTPLDKMKRSTQEAQDALANALEVNESHQKLNGKLQERVTELEEENKKLNAHVEKQITKAREAGM